MASNPGKRPASGIESPERTKEKRIRLPKTCEWITRESGYKKWKAGEDLLPILWIHGPPGCGKTFLAQFIVDELESSQEHHAVTSYFCDEYSSPDSILLSILQQLQQVPMIASEIRASISGQVEELLEPSPPGDDLTYKLWDKFMHVSSVAPPFYLVVDGLDEIQSQYLQGFGFNILNRLIEVASAPLGRVRLLVTSRTVQVIRSVLPDHSEIVITAEKVQEDMENYIATEVDRHEVLRPYRDTIIPTLVEQSDGIFIWSSLAVKSLGLENDGEAALQRLQQLPPLDDVYSRLLEQTAAPLPAIHLELRNQILRWVTAAIRPIRLVELANAVSIESNSFIPDIEDRAISVCSSLVKVENNLLKPMHFSLKDFLRRGPSGLEVISAARSEQANLQIAKTCLRYLSHPAFSNPVENLTDTEHALTTYPFLEYATLYWVHHVSASEKSNPELQSLIKAFISSRNATVWLDCFLPLVLSRSVLPIPPRASYSIRFAYFFLNLKPNIANYFDASQKPDVEGQLAHTLSTFYEETLDEMRAKYGVDSSEALEKMVDLAEVYGWLPKMGPKAQSLLEEAFQKVAKMDDSRGKAISLTIHQALADGYKRGGRYEDAKKLLSSLLELPEDVLKPNHPRTMFVLDSIGWICMRLGQFDESAAHLRRALDIAIARYGTRSPMTLRSKMALAEVLNKLGRTEESESLCEELKSQVREHHENGTPLPRDSISQLNTLAAVLMQQRKYKEAVETWETVVADRRNAFGDKHQMTLWATQQLGIAMESAGHLQGALKLFETLLPKQQEVLKDHPDIRETSRRLEDLRSRLG